MPPLRVLLLNQSSGPLYQDLARDLSDAFPGSILYTGHDSSIEAPHLVVVRGPRYEKASRLRRTLSWLGFLLGSIRVMVNTPTEIPVLVVSNPPMLPWIVAVANLLSGRRFVLLLYDIYPDVLVRLGILSDRNPITVLWRWAERFTRRRAMRIVVIGPRMLERVAADPYRNRITLIPTWADDDRFMPIARRDNAFANAHGIGEGDLVVMYSGNIGYTHDLEDLIRAALEFKNDPQVRFLVIGEGGGKHRLQQLAEALGVSNVLFLPPVPPEILPISLAAADVSAVSIAAGFEGLSMPSKTYFAMAAGSAILGLSDPSSDLATIIEEHRCGVNVRPGDVAGAAAAIRKMRDEPQTLALFRKNSREAAVRHYSRRENTKKFIELFRDLNSSESSSSC